MAIVCCNERLRCAMICSHVDLKTIQKAKEKGAPYTAPCAMAFDGSDPSDARGLTKGSGPDIILQLL